MQINTLNEMNMNVTKLISAFIADEDKFLIKPNKDIWNQVNNNYQIIVSI